MMSAHTDCPSDNPTSAASDDRIELDVFQRPKAVVTFSGKRV
jgi:hypothetical protein